MFLRLVLPHGCLLLPPWRLQRSWPIARWATGTFRQPSSSRRQQRGRSHPDRRADRAPTRSALCSAEFVPVFCSGHRGRDGSSGDRGGTAGFVVHSSDAPVLTTWLNWFASDAMDRRCRRSTAGDRNRPWLYGTRPDRRTLAEGVCILAVLALATALIAVSTCALVVAALFAERRSHEALLSSSIEQLRNQERSFRQLLASLPAAIHTTDTAGRIMFYNKTAADLWGVAPELGKDKCSDLGRLYYPDGTLVPPDECPTNLCLAEKRAIEGREALFERPDGTRIPIIPYPAPLIDADGDVAGVVSMKIDITERKQAEQALAERNAQLELAQVAARVGSYTYDSSRDSAALWCKRPMYGGIVKGNMEISAEQWCARVHREDLQRLRAENICAFKERRRELVSEFRFVLPGGEIRWIEARSLVAYDDAGRALRMTGVYIDVTERRSAENQKNLLIAER